MKVICRVSFLPDAGVISSGILRQNEYTVHDVRENTSVEEIMRCNPDVLLFDPCAPLEKIINLRKEISANPVLKDVPIIAVTGEELSLTSDIGRLVAADVCLSSPVDQDELLRLLQFASHVRRIEQQRCLCSGKVSLDTLAMSVSVEGRNVAIRPREYELLKILVKSPGCVFSREQLNCALGSKVSGRQFGRSIDTHIKSIRKALGKYGKCIRTVFGRGFKYEDRGAAFEEEGLKDPSEVG